VRSAAAPVDAHDRDVRREGLTMARCVSTTVGPAVAHWFAFSPAGRLLDPMAEDPRNDGSTKARALGVAAIVLVLGLVVAGIKHALGH
jgi:hypothetical protein